MRRYYSPIWEQYLKTLRKDSDYPKLTGKYKNDKIIKPVTRVGGALEIINSQRSGAKLVTENFPDVINMNLYSGKTWL